MVIALHLENVPQTDGEDGMPVFDSPHVAEAVIGAFCLGCAVGVEFPTRVPDILEQTHGDGVAEIVDECRASLNERIAEAKAAAEPLEAESFIGAMIDGLEERPYADSDTAQNALSMGFEYGCILATVERGAAIVVRNEFNRSQEAAVAEFTDGESTEAPEGPDPFQSLQAFAAEVMSAYEEDIGFVVG